MNAKSKQRLFLWLAVLFGSWNVVGSIAAFASGVLWSVRLSELPPAGFLVHGVVFAVVAALALSAARSHAHQAHLWVLAMAISLGEWIVGVLRVGCSGDDGPELAILLFASLASLPLLRNPASRAARGTGAEPPTVM